MQPEGRCGKTSKSDQSGDHIRIHSFSQVAFSMDNIRISNRVNEFTPNGSTEFNTSQLHDSKM